MWGFDWMVRVGLDGVRVSKPKSIIKLEVSPISEAATRPAPPDADVGSPQTSNNGWLALRHSHTRFWGPFRFISWERERTRELPFRGPPPSSVFLGANGSRALPFPSRKRSTASGPTTDFLVVYNEYP